MMIRKSLGKSLDFCDLTGIISQIDSVGELHHSKFKIMLSSIINHSAEEREYLKTQPRARTVQAFR